MTARDRLEYRAWYADDAHNAGEHAGQLRADCGQCAAIAHRIPRACRHRRLPADCRVCRPLDEAADS